jgi:hypothetical protein
MLPSPRLARFKRKADYRRTSALGFRPRHLAPLARPRANDSASSSRSSASLRLLSAFASSVSPPCLYCGWLAPRLTVSGLREPCMRQTQLDPTPGVPPTAQIWDPRFLPTYGFARSIFSRYFKLPFRLRPIAFVTPTDWEQDPLFPQSVAGALRRGIVHKLCLCHLWIERCF